MLSLTKGAAKELVPVAGVPVVVRVLEECAASGIDRVIVVVSPTKQSVIDAYSMSVQGFFVKPSGFDELEHTIKTIMEYWKRCIAPSEYE